MYHSVGKDSAEWLMTLCSWSHWYKLDKKISLMSGFIKSIQWMNDELGMIKLMKRSIVTWINDG